MDPCAWVNSITFSDDSTINFSKNDVVVIVGPNNSGKSAALRGINEKFINPGNQSLVIKKIFVTREGSQVELTSWLENNTVKIVGPSSNVMYQMFGASMHHSRLQDWSNTNSVLHEIAGFFCHFLSADSRLNIATPPPSIAITHQAPQHPIHFMQRDDGVEAKLSKQFRRAFGVDLIVHRNAGNTVPLYVGPRPILQEGQDRVSISYIRELEKLPTLHSQGDGMRSFAGILLYAFVGQYTTLLIDEPEAFLHPPQARLLGGMLVIDKPSDRQLFIATHSGDVLRGILDSDNPNVQVIRLRREGDINVTRRLDNNKIAHLWNDSLLRYSNILDGLFHEKVIICEGDSDCRFYAAILDAVYEIKGEDERKPDVMFTHCGGKGRIPLVIRSLRELEVPLLVITDFDVLSDEHPLSEIVEAAGGSWDTIVGDWKEVKNAVDSIKPDLNTQEVKNEINHILQEIKDPVFPSMGKRRIQEILRKSSPWSIAKSVGSQFIPSGQPTQALNRLRDALQNLGILVTPVGEVEGFAKSVGNHGPIWVNEVLKRDLKTDTELQAARDFVSIIISA